MTESDPLDALADELTIHEAAKATRLSTLTIRRAIRAGHLKAWIPLGKTTRNIGRGPGYRINRKELVRWFLGDAAVPRDGSKSRRRSA